MVGYKSEVQIYSELVQDLVIPGEGNGKPFQYSCLENYMDRGAWKAAVHGVEKSNMTKWLSLTHPNHSPFFKSILFFLPTISLAVTIPHSATKYGLLLTLFFISRSLSVPHCHRCFRTRDSASATAYWDSPVCWCDVQFSSVTQSCPTLCNPMNGSMPGLPVHHQLPEFTQTHVHWAGDAIQPSHPLSSPSPPAPNPSQHQSLFQWVNSSHEVAKVLQFQL